ncbi:hypothetical protein HDU93_002774 [Gonapodya sp. JEL0774]|nr:hypothetical protein HDU93_002774 [Gonapodya sp. JEL0774]
MDTPFTPALQQRQASVSGSPFSTSTKQSRILFESCVENVESYVATAYGCSFGGTTPSLGMVQTCHDRLRIPIHVMIRPRGGDFLYSDLEFAVMRRDIEAFKQVGVAGVVFGILRRDGNVDVERTAELASLAAPLAVTFHRAFDVTPDPDIALSHISTIPNITRILTSGQAPTSLEGLRLIHQLIQRAPPHITIMPGGGITPALLPYVLEASAVAGVVIKEIHMAVLGVVPSAMEYRRTDVFMGGLIGPPEYERQMAEPGKMRAVVESLRR